MLEFCPECSNLLRRSVINGFTYLACGCGYKKELEGQTSNPGVRSTPKKSTPRKTKVKAVSWDPPEVMTLYSRIKNAPGSKVGSAGAGKSPVILKIIQDKLDTKYYNCSKCTRLMSANLFCKLHERKVGKKDICKSFEPIHGGLGAKKVDRRSMEGKHGSALKANRRCGKCIFYQDQYCHAHKKAATVSGASCEDFEYIYERSDELLNKKD